MNKTIRRQHGISMVEALVALVVISVGMLGIAGLYLSSLQASRTAKLRSQAVMLVSSIADRIRANREAGAAYDTDTYAGAPETQDCDIKNCIAATLAQDDLARWIEDAQEALPGGDAVTGTVQVTDRVRPDSDNFVITVVWHEANTDEDFNYTLSLNLANRL